jgi:hypothetical protein
VSDRELLRSVREAQALLAHDPHRSTTMRAHGSPGYLTPAEFCELDVAIQRHILAALARLKYELLKVIGTQQDQRAVA